jgi:hypothetical protein
MGLLKLGSFLYEVVFGLLQLLVSALEGLLGLFYILLQSL